MIIPTRDKRFVFMRMVYDWASCSKDPRTKIGAVIVRDNVPVISGYNNFPSKVQDLSERYAEKEVKYNFMIHGEQNAILSAAALGIPTKGTILFTQGIPCCECTKSIINAKISKVVCHSCWPNLTHSDKWVKSIEISKIMMQEAGVELEWFDEKLNIFGYLDGKMIEV